MSKRKKVDQIEATEQISWRPYSIVTSLEKSVKHLEIIAVLQHIQWRVAQIMTLATKLGAFHILNVLARGGPMSKFYMEQTFWRHCTSCVTLITNEGLPGSRSEEETVILRELQQSWKELKSSVCVPDLSRDELARFIEAQVVTYSTNIKVYISTTLEQRLKKAASVQANMILDTLHPNLPKTARSALHGVLLGYIIRRAMFREAPNWQEKRRAVIKKYFTAETWKSADRIVAEHQEFTAELDTEFEGLQELEASDKKPDEEPVELKFEKFVQNNWVFFLPYFQYLSKSVKKCFALLPQWNAKARAIQLNRFSIPFVFKVAKKLGLSPKSWFLDGDADVVVIKVLQRVQYLNLDDAHHIFSLLFKIPRSNQTKTRFGSTLMTDCVRVSWMFERKVAKKPKEKKTTTKKRKASSSFGAAAAPLMDASHIPVLQANQLRRGLYYHGQDFFLRNDAKDRDFLFVDPGHANIMTGVREEIGVAFDPKLCPRYRLTNKRNQVQTGQVKRKKEAQLNRNQDLEVTAAFQDLALNSSKTWDPGRYLEHLSCYLKHWNSLFRHSFLPYVRHFAFANYQGRQRMVHRIAAELQNGRTPGNTIVVVGNGVHKATSRGYDAAPGKQLRKQLAKFMPVVMASEQFTSCKTACCHAPSVHGHHDSHSRRAGYKIRGLLHCPLCKTTLDRDHNAAVNIRALFWYQSSNRTLHNILSV